MSFTGSQQQGFLKFNPGKNPNTVYAQRAPTANDTEHQDGTPWIDQANNIGYIKIKSSAGSATWVTSGGADVDSVTGTLNRITVAGTATDPTVDIAAAYVGQTSITTLGTVTTGVWNGTGITTLGTVTTGVWNGTAVTVPNGGTGVVSVAADSLLAGDGTDPLLAVSRDEFIRQADVVLTAVQVKALRATPITLVAAPGAGKAIFLQSAILKLNYGSEVFAETTDNLAIKLTDGSGAEVSQTIESTGFIDQAADTYTTAFGKIDAIATAVAMENAVIVIHNTGDGEITGNASDDSTVSVRVFYRVVEI